VSEIFGGNCLRHIFEIYFIYYHNSMPVLQILLSARKNKCTALCMVILGTREDTSYPTLIFMDPFIVVCLSSLELLTISGVPLKIW
jgi:hypothetical protein